MIRIMVLVVININKKSNKDETTTTIATTTDFFLIPNCLSRPREAALGTDSQRHHLNTSSFLL